MNEDDIRRALTRIAHEIVERNKGIQNLLLVGLQRRGVPLAERIGGLINEFEGHPIPVGALDVSLYRDDLSRRVRPSLLPTSLPLDVEGSSVVLVDDVFYTGRTARSALNALMDLGRPASVQLAVMVDRGHRELPIQADYVGKNFPTGKNEEIRVRVDEIDGCNEVLLVTGIGGVDR